MPIKQIINISLGDPQDDYEFNATFLAQKFNIKRFGTDGDLDKTAELLVRWNNQADAIGLDSVKFPYTFGTSHVVRKESRVIKKLSSQLTTPVTTGDALRIVSHEWSIRHLQFIYGNNYFNNAKVLFMSGLSNTTLAEVLSEYTRNLTFADPILGNGIPKFLHSLTELKLYALGLHDKLQLLPIKKISQGIMPLNAMNEYLIRKAVEKASIVVLPYYDFYAFIEKCNIKELKDKTIITSTAYDDRIAYLKDKGVTVIIDTTPKILQQVVGFSVLEALIIAALQKPQNEITDQDLLEIITDLKMDPRVVYPYGKPKRVNRFAYITYPTTGADFKNIPVVNQLSQFSPPIFMKGVEEVMTKMPPKAYAQITGIASPTGIEAEGWIISLGMTREKLLQSSPETVTRRILKATQVAQKHGAQIVGLATLPMGLENAIVQASRLADVPLTSGNNYIASSTLWAAAEAVRKLKLVQEENGKLKAKAMVIGATGPAGSVCCRLLAKAFTEVHMISRNMAKLLTLKASILAETPQVKLHLSTRADKHLDKMDVIVSASAGAASALDIMDVKPGCVITDGTTPQILTPEDEAKRPDVLVINSGMFKLPGQNVEFTRMGLPANHVNAGLAETVVLALEGRFELFTIGSKTEWEKVREIYRLGLKHEMKLSSISGLSGELSDDRIQMVREKALEAITAAG